MATIADDSPRQDDQSPPLAGLRVLEIGHFVAAPFCTRLLGDLGADVIKIEPPSGDPVRSWGASIDGNSLWWSIHGRNKKSLALNLKNAAARDIVLRLVEHCDVVVENFRPGQLASMGLGPQKLRERNPRLIVAHISGYGQDGPYRDRAAFGVIGEAIGGLRHLTNHSAEISDLPPVRVGISIGDSLAGLYAAFGIMGALWARDRAGGDGRSRTVDVALTEAVFSMTEGMLPEYGRLGKIRQPSGGTLATTAPSNAYPTIDGQWVLIAANSEPLFGALTTLLGRPEMAMDARFVNNPSRVAHAAELDRIIAAWTAQRTARSLVELLELNDIPATKAYTVADCATDPQYLHRRMVREVEDPLLGAVLHTGIVPHLPETPGTIRWAGAPIGHHTQQILEDLGMNPAEIATLRQIGAVR